MRKILTFLFAALMSVGMWAAAPVVNGVQIGDLYYNLTNGNKTAEVTSMPSGKYTGGIIIPESVEYYSVPFSVTSIGDYAFSGCSGLTSIEIPNSVTSIGDGAFYGCSALTSIEIPNSVTSIGNAAFAQCTGLTSVTIGNSVISIGESAFYGCTGLTSIEIPNSVTSIRDYAFEGCFYLETVTILAESLESYGAYAFESTVATFTIYVPAGSVDTYKAGWAAYADKIVAIPAPAPSNTCGDGLTWEFNAGVLTISYDGVGSGAMTDYDEDHPAPWLSYRGSITSVIIPYGVTSIGVNAFYDCTALTSIEIPNSVTSIGQMAFAVTGLTSITIPNSVTSIGDAAFFMCMNLESVTIPNSVTSIGMGAFGMCGLTSVTIPNSVKSIGQMAFAYCTNITDVYCYPNAANLTWNVGEEVDFKESKATKCHVPSNYYAEYVAKFGATVNVTFVGDLPASDFAITPKVDPQNDGVYYSTFYDSANKYALPAGVEAYVATRDGANLLLSKIAEAGEVIPANVAVILKSSVTPFTLSISEADAVPVNAINNLQGTDEAIGTPPYCYVLAGENGVGFYHYTASMLNPHKAYVIYSGSNAPRRMPFIFDAATGVENVQGNVQSTKVLRDGQLIIIRNGVEYNANGMMVK